jgi:DNA-binding response OmpR family regulator
VHVELVRWPAERTRLDRLRTAGTARLVLVERDSAPPIPVDELEDWIRVPASEADLRTRLAVLEQRADAGLTSRPVLDRDGLLRYAGRWVSLPPVEHRLTAALIERFGAVVARDALSRAGWPDGSPSRNALDVHVVRLRRRVRPIGLTIRTVRSRGYLLETSDSAQEVVGQA